MQRIGYVHHISSSRNMILKAENNIPQIGDQVTNENLKPIGTIFDIFGPVTSPYVSVRSNIDEPERYIHHVLYAVPSPKRRREKRKR